MTPKEKAKDLVKKSMPLAHDWEADNKVVAVKIALLCVEEILKARTVGNTGVILDKEYWEEVKEEISLL